MSLLSLSNNIALSFQQLSTDSKGIFSQSSNSVELSSEEVVSVSQGFRLLDDANSTLSVGYSLNALIFNQAASAGPNGDGTFGLSASSSTSVGIDVGINAPGMKMTKGARKKLNNFINKYDGFDSVKLISKNEAEFTYKDGSTKSLDFKKFK